MIKGKMREEQKKLKVNLLEDLKEEIEKVRNKLNNSISNNVGKINEGEILVLSQKLDKLIVRYLNQKKNEEKE